MSTDAHKALIRRYWQEASTRGLPAVIDDYFAPDVVAHPPASASPAPIRGLAAWKRFTSAQWGAFPDLTATVEDMVAEGDRVALRLTAHGTHSGPLMGLPPTGKPVSFLGMEIFRIRDGKIVESWGQFDALGLLQQLGAIPAAPAAPDQPAAGPTLPAATAARGESATSPEAHKALVRRLSEEFWNQGNAAVFDEVFAADFVDRTPQPGSDGTKEGFRHLALTLRAALADVHATVDDLVAEGDSVAWRWTFRGTHTGELMGIPATGLPVALTGITVDRVADGRIAERWSQVDNLGFLQQLGAIPAPGQSGA